MNKKINTIIAFSLSLLFASCGNDDKKAIADNTPAITVKVNAVSKDNNTNMLSTSGKIEAVNSANLSTRMMGFVDKIYANVGDKVQNGQLLLRINNADINAKLGQVNAGITEANAAFANAEKDYKRFTSLFSENSASQKELDDVTANYTMAKARVEAAKQMKNEVNAQLSYSDIRAPFSGVVTNKFIKEGDMANPGMPLLEVEAPGSFQVLAMVPESAILQIKSGTQVDILVKSLNETLNGKVTEISTSSKNTGGQFMVKVLVENANKNLLSGMFATVQFPLEKSAKSTNNTVLVPLEAIVTQGQLSGIYTVSQSNTALLRWLRLGQTFGNEVEVLSGLNSDESYIVNAEGKLFNGVKVSVQ